MQTDPAGRVAAMDDDALDALHKHLDTSTVDDPATVEAHHLVAQEMLKRGLDHGHEDDAWSRAVIVVDEAPVDSVDDIEFPGDLTEPLTKALADGGIVQVLLTVDGYVLKAEPNVNTVHVDSIMGAERPKAMLKRIVERDGRFVVMAEESDREFGTYDTREQAEERLAQIERFSKAESYKVPDSVRSAARRALEWIGDGKAGDGFTSVGRNRAKQLAEGGAIGRDTLIKMRAYFARHGKQRGDHARLDGGEPTPWRVAWDAWGGDAGRSWVNGLLGSVEKRSIPKPITDLHLNLENRQHAIDEYLYGPMNPDEPGDYWKRLGAVWDVSADQAATTRCGNCAAFNVKPEIVDAIAESISDEGDAVVEAANLGYCELFQFKCAADRSCSAWLTGGPIAKATDFAVDEEELLSTMDADDLSDFGSWAYLSDEMVKRGNPEALRDYWREGGKGQISWGSGGDFTACVSAVSRYMDEEQAKGYCAIRHFETTGMWPGDRRNRANKAAYDPLGPAATFTLPGGVTYTLTLPADSPWQPLAKHGAHDQSSHGNWATGSGGYDAARARRQEAMAAGDTRRPMPRDADGRVINPDATGGYKANIPETVTFKGETLTPEHSLWHHLESDGNGGYRITEERAKAHQKAIEDATRGVPPSDDPTFYMLGGGPAAGKTTAIKSGLADVPSPDKAVQINADDVKETLPEFDRMRFSDNDSDFFNAAAFSHEESSYLAKQIQKAAVSNRQDMVLDGTGDSTPDKLERKIGQAREGGYKVVGVYATIPTSEAVRRSNDRSLKENERRFVPEAVVRGTHRDVSRALPVAIKGGWFDRVTLIDTSQRGGAVKIGEGSGSSWTVNDPGRWDEFQGKGDE